MKWQEAAENCKMRSFIKFHMDDQIKENERDGACSTHEGR
jgi:hypothetical protein